MSKNSKLIKKKGAFEYWPGQNKRDRGPGGRVAEEFGGEAGRTRKEEQRGQLEAKADDEGSAGGREEKGDFTGAAADSERAAGRDQEEKGRGDGRSE